MTPELTSAYARATVVRPGSWMPAFEFAAMCDVRYNPPKIPYLGRHVLTSPSLLRRLVPASWHSAVQTLVSSRLID